MNIKTESQYIGFAEIGESVIYIEQRKDQFIAGGMTNAGIIEEYTFQIDKDFSLDENLAEFYDFMVEEESNAN
tara:strand:+ start:162 stop:380 length:219 start_codon:yes stop_codon:yes gene_type:complete